MDSSTTHPGSHLTMLPKLKADIVFERPDVGISIAECKFSPAYNRRHETTKLNLKYLR